MKIHTSKDTITTALIILITSLVSEFSFVYYFQKGETVTYYDAIVHLNIARETLDSLTPGVAQLITLWLPLPHILMQLFIWNDFLWHTGMAGSFVSMIAYVITVLFIFKTAKMVTNSYLAGTVGAAIVGANPNLLYLQTTPMTESLALATIAAYLYYLIKWSKSGFFIDLVLTGVCGLLASLTRYESWFLVSFGTLVIFYVSYQRKKFAHIAQVLLYAAVVFVGIVLWILAHFILFGNPLFFFNGIYSPKVQQATLYSINALPTKQHIFMTLLTSLWDIVDISGMSIVCLAALSLILCFFKEKDKKTLQYLLVAFGPAFASIVTLYLGIIVIYVPQVSIQNTFGHMSNMRYGLVALPAIALVTSLLAARQRVIGWGVLLVLFLQVAFMYKNNTVYTLNEPLQTDRLYTKDNPIKQVTQILQSHCHDNRILMMLFVHGVEALESNFSLQHFVYEGNGTYWQSALKDPTPYATCIVLDAQSTRHDQVRNALFKNSILSKHYQLLFKNEKDLVYVRK